MSTSARVLFANQAFYDAFRSRDADTMDLLWAQEHPVACIHPGWPALSDREAVMESWGGILANPDSPAISCHNAEVFFAGETAIVLCYEVIEESVLVATNIFVTEAGQWKLVHHQAGPCNRDLAELDEEADPGEMQ